jgi:GTPase SAR1 family protein
MSGQGKYRSLWEKQYGTVEAIIFVVDAADELRFGVAHNELEMILENQGKSLYSTGSNYIILVSLI